MTTPHDAAKLATLSIADLLAYRDAVNAECERRIADLELLRGTARKRKPRSDKGASRKENKSGGDHA